jgi:hypothetical protein
MPKFRAMELELKGKSKGTAGPQSRGGYALEAFAERETDKCAGERPRWKMRLSPTAVVDGEPQWCA